MKREWIRLYMPFRNNAGGRRKRPVLLDLLIESMSRIHLREDFMISMIER